MRKKPFILFFVFINCLTVSFAQKDKLLDSLCSLCNRAVTDTDKVAALNNLSNYYYGSKFNRQGDSIFNMQLRIAELSGNKNLVLKTYFDNPVENISAWSTTEDFNRTIQFIQKGIEYATKINRYDYIVIGYTRLAGVLRKNGKSNEAVTAANNALFNFLEINSDSLKAVVYIELGDSYQSKGESVLACKSYNAAFDMAIKENNHYLESHVYRRLAQLYLSLGDAEKAKEQLINSIKLNEKYKDGEGLIKDYLEMGRVTDDTFYLKQVLSFSDSLHIYNYKARAKELLLAIYTTTQRDGAKAHHYLHTQPELKEYYMQGGIESYYFELGEIFFWAYQLPDSALKYYKMAESGLVKNYDSSKAKFLYLQFGSCYEIKNDRKNAIDYFKKFLSYCNQSGDLFYIVWISNKLTVLYKEDGDFKDAVLYKEIAANTQDALTKQEKTKNVALLGVERERRLHEEEIRQKDLAAINRRNVQYTFITVAICSVFIGMLVMGMFPVSRFTIRLLGYFFFISLFEFIVLVLDNNVLHYITDGEPLKLWLIKIGLIGLLVPVQHFLEHKITTFLESRQLLKARKKFSLKSLWSKKKIRRSHAKQKSKTEEIENDTAVL